MVFRLGLILLSAVFDLNVLLLRYLQVSRRYRHIGLLNPLRMPSGIDEIVLLDEYDQSAIECDGSIN